MYVWKLYNQAGSVVAQYDVFESWRAVSKAQKWLAEYVGNINSSRVVNTEQIKFEVGLTNDTFTLKRFTKQVARTTEA